MPAIAPATSAYERIQQITERLEGVHKSGGKWKAKCPAHADQIASLSIDEGKSGKVVIHCHAGCSPKAVISALNLRMSILFPPKPSRNGDGKHAKRFKFSNKIAATYDYHDAAGELSYQSCRYEPKDFRQRHKSASGAWVNNLHGIPPLPYRLPVILAAAAAGKTVAICEGEKDADTLAALGFAATTNSGGAGKWREEFAEHFRGAGRAVIFADNDDAGRAHAESVAYNLSAVVTDVRIVHFPDLPAKGDVGDFIAALRGGVAADDVIVGKLRERVAAAPIYVRGDPPAKSVHAAKPSTNGDGHHATEGEDGGENGEVFSNFREEEYEDENGKTRTAKVGLPVQTISGNLLGRTGGWPKRVGRMLFVEKANEPKYLENCSDLFGWIGIKCQKSEDDNGLVWATGADKVEKSHLEAGLRMLVENFDSVEPFPHWPLMPGHYYIHEPLTGGDGKAFVKLIDFFFPATLVDRSLISAFFMSLFAGIPSGQRPGFLITGTEEDEKAGRGVGKTSLVRMAARLAGGLIDYGSNEKMPDFKKRLLSPESRFRRIVCIDNVKSLKFSHGDLEGIMTSDVISGHQMYVGEGRRPNTITFALTINGASMSKDMAQRCVPIKLSRPAYNCNWEAETVKFIDENRWAIIGDIIEILKTDTPKFSSHSRWGAWEEAVLSKVPLKEECRAMILERQDAIDDDESEKEMIREAFVAELIFRGHKNPEECVVFIPSKDVAGIVNEAMNERYPSNKVSALLNTMSIRGLRKNNRHGAERGWLWCGNASSRDEPQVAIFPRPSDQEKYKNWKRKDLD